MVNIFGLAIKKEIAATELNEFQATTNCTHLNAGLVI